jgi:hypothetical protein
LHLLKLKGDGKSDFVKTESAMGRPEYLGVSLVACYVGTYRMLEVRLTESSTELTIHQTTHIKQYAWTEDYHR